MTTLADYTTYQDAHRHFAPQRLWELFDGSRAKLNIAHECIDRHAGDPSRVALWIAFADGHDDCVTFQTISVLSSQFANWLVANGIRKGDRVAIMLEPSLAFYAALFGTMKHGAVAVPLFTLFGPDGVRLRVDDCLPSLLLTTSDVGPLPNTRVVVPDASFMHDLRRFDTTFTPVTAANDMALFQYTSGTTRDLP